MKKSSVTILVLAVLFFCLAGWDQRVGDQASKTLILAHNLNKDHPVHKAMAFMAQKVKEKSEGSIEIKLYPNGQLGSEREVLELVQLGAVAMTKVSTMNLESFTPLFAVFNLPYIFKSKEHYFGILDGEIGEKMLAAPRENLFQGLTYYDAGARSFYANKEILTPQDLSGLKIRVMGSQMAIQMMRLLGGSPTPMPYGEVYTALQQGVIDGAENNATALTLSRHGEVVKSLSISEHTMLPDVLLISTKVWESLGEQQRAVILEAANESKEFQRGLWKEVISQSMVQIKQKMGVKVVRPDKRPFIERVRPLHDKLGERGEEYRQIIDIISK